MERETTVSKAWDILDSVENLPSCVEDIIKELIHLESNSKAPKTNVTDKEIEKEAVIHSMGFPDTSITSRSIDAKDSFKEGANWILSLLPKEVNPLKQDK